jgi:Ni,Fe-hydrogenase I large subunit
VTARLAIDPVTRVDGGLRIEVTIANRVVDDAWASATMFRGMESVLAGRDPRSAWLLAQRICGACSGVHALASVRAVEAAFGVAIPRNARVIRNLLMGTEFVLDHIAHFYYQHALDWIDPSAALTADPARTATLARSMGARAGSTAASFAAARERLSRFARPGGSGPFFSAGPDAAAGASSGSSPELALMVLAHHLEALDRQRRLVQMQTLLGGKSPHPQSFLVGGAALPVPWGGPPPAHPGHHPIQIDPRAPAALSADGLALMSSIVGEARAFVDGVYVPDVLAIAMAYPDFGRLGGGLGDHLAFGEFPLADGDAPELLLPRGRIVAGDLSSVGPVDQVAIGETIAHAHYTYADDDAAYRHPFSGMTRPRYAGPPPPFTSLEGSDRYSWIKAPRYQRAPMEVGPLSRMLVAYVEGRTVVADRVEEVVARLGMGPDALVSTTGRMLARAIEASVVVDRLEGWIGELRAAFAGGDLAVTNLDRWAPGAWPSSTKGWSLGEGPRGAVGHWVTIADRAISAYQVVDGSTWNLSPRDAAGRRGPVEQALVGTPVADPERPVEVMRTVHSFAPCPTCGAQ